MTSFAWACSETCSVGDLQGMRKCLHIKNHYRCEIGQSLDKSDFVNLYHHCISHIHLIPQIKRAVIAERDNI